MTTEYELQAVAQCPVNGATDVYRVTVKADRTVMVETILEAVAKAGKEPITQEAFTEALHTALQCSVVTVGYHSGVKTTVTCA